MRRLLDSTLSGWLPDLSGLQVLVIEDDEDARTILVDVLQFAGATVVACGDAYAGLEVIDASRPDIIVCDLALPRMDGISFLQALRSHRDPETRRVPMMAITAYGHLYGAKELLSLGCEGYMMKPLSLDRVCRAVQKLALTPRHRGQDHKAS
jgi:CheY-like chemotaxis protein